MEKKQSNPYNKELLRKCEIKRIGERLTKRELTNVMGVHYNFYWNCITDRNEVSPNLALALEEYLETPTHKVYEKIFALREGDKGGKVKRDKNGKELYDESLKITEEYEKEVLDKLTKKRLFKEPRG